MEISVLDVNFVDTDAKGLSLEKKCEKVTIGNINDYNKSPLEERNEADGHFESEETEKGLEIRFVDNSVNSLQNGSNNLHKKLK